MTANKRKIANARKLVQSVAVVSAALLVQIGFHTANATNEAVSPTGVAVPANYPRKP